MRNHDWLFSFLIMSVCFAVCAVLTTGCNQRRSEGQKPSQESVADNSNHADSPAMAGGEAHVAQVQRFPGGVEPNDHKAQKLVNQLFNYCAGLCAKTQECPADLDAVMAGVKENYQFFWPKDPWGKLYQYKKIDDRTFDVWSSGPDGEDGTDDDIHVAKSNLDNLPN